MDEDKPKTVQETLLENKRLAESRVKQEMIESKGRPVSYRISAMIKLAALGYEKKQICMEFGLSSARVSQILNSPTAKMEIERLQQEFYVREPQKMFQAMVPKAVRRLNKLMSPDQKGSVQLGAIGMTLDRAYGKPVAVVEHQGSGIKEILMLLDKKNTAESSAKTSNTDTIEAEFKEVLQAEPEKPKDSMDNWLDENDF